MFRKLFRKIVRREEGISALEYALIAALIALAIIAGAGALGTQMDTSLDQAATDLEEAHP